MTSRERQASVTASSISDNDDHDNDQYEAFQDIIQTIRSRKAKRPVSQQSSGPSTVQSTSLRNTPSVDLSLYQGGERTELTFNEEEELPHTRTEEEVNEQRVRNHIKERMQIYRNKKKEERRKLLEERKARWIERQKRLGVYVEPSENASTSSGSSMSGLTEEERQIKREARRKLHKMIPLTTVVDELKKNLDMETTMRGDFLETIRIIRGIKREEFYREETPEIYEEEEEEVEEEEEETPVEEEHVEMKSPTQTPNLKDVKARVISRWPEGHRHHTKAAKADWSFLTHYSDAELTVELAYLLPEYMRDVERIRKTRKTPWNSTTNFKTKRIQRNLEFESWREEMMRIAYDEEFGRGKSKMFSAVPLPKIKETSGSVNTSRSSRVSLSDRSDGRSEDNWSPRGRRGNVNSISAPQQQISPYKYNPVQKSTRQRDQAKNQLASRNQNNVHNGQHKTMSKIYRPVGRRAISQANKAVQANKTANVNVQKTGDIPRQNGAVLTGRSNGMNANGRRRTEPKDINLNSQSTKGDKSKGPNANSASDQLSQDSGQQGVTTITVYFNTDQMDNNTSSPNRTHVVSIPTGGTDPNQDESIIRINSPINREDNVTKLLGDIQEYRSKHPTVNQVRVELRSNDVADID